MYTFNFGFVFEGNSVHTIVCASETPIDESHVASVITERLPAALAARRSSSKAVAEVAKAITEECGCMAVTVKADAVVHVSRVK